MRLANAVQKGMRAAMGLVLMAGLAASAARAAETELPDFEPKAGVAGDLASVGSDTLNNLMAFWSEAIGKHYPNVRVTVEGKGSGTAPPALAAGAAQIGPMSRHMTVAEIEEIERRRGAKPIEITVAIDCLAVYVHKDNPIAGLTLEQADGIFSRTNLRGHDEIRTWGEAGLAGEWERLPISLYGRNAASGTYAFFKEQVLARGDFKDTVKEQPGSATVVGGVAEDKAGIGYSGIGYRTSGVKVVPLAAKAGEPFVEATFDAAMDGTYPLGRGLLLYVVKTPGQPLDPALKEFLTFILSKEGQEIVVKDGYGALPPEIAAEQLALLE